MSSRSSVFPSHVGIIMDGNGRWARSRNLPRTHGHKEGLETAKKIVAHASDLGIKALSLYTFSTENWRRTEEEVGYLMNLIKTNLRHQYNFYKEKSIKVVHSGDIAYLPEAIQKEIALTEEDTKDFTGLCVNLLINYGGQDEIVRAVRKALAKSGEVEANAEAAANGTDAKIDSADSGNTSAAESATITEATPAPIDINTIKENLDHPELPEMDLLIRTGGELRLSNFMLWQSAYAELYFDDTYWPDWTPEHFDRALEDYAGRQRRFGGVKNS